MNKKRKMKETVKYATLIFIFIILAATSFFASVRLTTLETLSYIETSEINYEVCLRENRFYEETCQPKGMSYIASAIDYVNVEFNYTFQTNKRVDFEYAYSIDGIITITERHNPENILFTRTVNLLEATANIEENVNLININENLTIDYSEYNDLVKQFMSEYNLLADSNLRLVLRTDIEGTYRNFDEPIHTDSSMELIIPLTESTIQITMDHTEVNQSEQITRDTNNSLLNTILFALGIILSLTALIYVGLLLMYFKKQNDKKSDYEKFIGNKLKNLDRMIVSAKVDTRLDEKDYEEVIDVEDFSELVDIADRLVKLITWTETKYPKKDETVSWFTVADEKRLYRKIYKSTDKEFK